MNVRWLKFVNVTDPCTLSRPVQFRNAQQYLCRKVFVHYPKHDGRGRGEEEVEENHQPVVNHGSAREATEELIPEQQVHIGLRNTSKFVWLDDKNLGNMFNKTTKTDNLLTNQHNSPHSCRRSK